MDNAISLSPAFFLSPSSALPGYAGLQGYDRVNKAAAERDAIL